MSYLYTYRVTSNNKYLSVPFPISGGEAKDYAVDCQTDDKKLLIVDFVYNGNVVDNLRHVLELNFVKGDLGIESVTVVDERRSYSGATIGLGELTIGVSVLNAVQFNLHIEVPAAYISPLQGSFIYRDM